MACENRGRTGARGVRGYGVGLAEPRGGRRRVWVRSPLLVFKKQNQSTSVQVWERGG